MTSLTERLTIMERKRKQCRLSFLESPLCARQELLEQHDFFLLDHCVSK